MIKNRKITTVLFDMDGVLVDSEFAMRSSGIKALEQYGVQAVHEDFFPFTGMGEDSFIGGVARKHGAEYTTDMKDLAYRIYGTECRGDIIVFEGIKEMIDALHSKKKMAVASAADRVKVLINLETIGVSESQFDALVTGSDVVKKKPDPEIYLKAAELVGVSPEECIVIEDAVAGVKAAKSAGMLCIGICSTFDAATLTEAGADFTVKLTPEILPIIFEEN